MVRIYVNQLQRVGGALLHAIANATTYAKVARTEKKKTYSQRQNRILESTQPML